MILFRLLAYCFPLALFCGTGNRTSPADAFVPQTVFYKYYLLFDTVPGGSVIPYYAQFHGLANNHLKTEGKKESPVVIEKPGPDCLFEYASPHPEMYADGFPDIPPSYYKMDSIRKHAPALASLNCSKITNAKGEAVYIYFTTITGPDELERMNPFLAFEGMNSLNPDLWNPGDFVKNNTAKISCENLEKGTYLFNWWDKNDSLYQTTARLWKTIFHFESAIDALRKKDDSLRSMFRSTGNTVYLDEANRLNFSKLQDAYEAQKAHEFLKVFQLGYGNQSFFDEHKSIRFGIRKEALVSHKISKKGISPEQLNNFLSKPKGKCPAAYLPLLEIFAR